MAGDVDARTLAARLRGLTDDLRKSHGLVRAGGPAGWGDFRTRLAPGISKRQQEVDLWSLPEALRRGETGAVTAGGLSGSLTCA